MTDTPKSADCVSFIREIAAIDPLSGGGEAKYFVTADFVKRACKLLERMDASAPAAPGGQANGLFAAIKHGDEVHQEWLKEAIENHFNGKPVPPPRANPSPAPSELDKLLAIENSQARFEAWMASGNYPEIADVALETLPDGQYKSQLTFAAWQAWQAVERMHQTIATDDYAQLARQLRDIAKNCNLNHIRGDGRIVIERAATILAHSPSHERERALGGQWFELRGHDNLVCCSTLHCCNPASWRFEGGGVGSNYCGNCRAKILAQSAPAAGERTELNNATKRELIAATLEKRYPQVAANVRAGMMSSAWPEHLIDVGFMWNLLDAYERKAIPTPQPVIDEAAENVARYRTALEEIVRAGTRKNISLPSGDTYDVLSNEAEIATDVLIPTRKAP